MGGNIMSTVVFVVSNPQEPETFDFYNLDEAQRVAETMASSLIGAYPKVEVSILEIDTDTFQLLKVHKGYGRLHLALKTRSDND